MNDIEAMIKFAEESGDKTNIGSANFLKSAYEKTMSENPNGYWLGYHGKVNYCAFCDVAKKTIKANKNCKWRVLKAEFPDGATTWTNYVNGIENDGVLRYLYATM